ncbi:MAG: tetratricopeptide repeat protein [Gemmatimonadales bacterium]
MSSRTLSRSVAMFLAAPFLLLACGGEQKSTSSPTGTAGASAPVVPASTVTTTLRSTAVAVLDAVPPTYEDSEEALRAGRYAEAARGFEAYSARKPENPWGWYMLGYSSWKGGEPERAMVAFDSALSRDPAHLKSLYNSARVLFELGRPREALDRIETAIATDSTVAEGYRLLGRAYEETGDPEGAVSAYRQALILDEHDAWALNNLGVLYLKEGMPQEALGPLARAVELKPRSPVFQNNLGNALERAGSPVAAKAAYAAALDADESYQKARVNLERVSALVSPDAGPEVEVGHLAEEFRFSLRVMIDSTR